MGLQKENLSFFLFFLSILGASRPIEASSKRLEVVTVTFKVVVGGPGVGRGGSENRSSSITWFPDLTQQVHQVVCDDHRL